MGQCASAAPSQADEEGFEAAKAQIRAQKAALAAAAKERAEKDAQEGMPAGRHLQGNRTAAAAKPPSQIADGEPPAKKAPSGARKPPGAPPPAQPALQALNAAAQEAVTNKLMAQARGLPPGSEGAAAAAPDPTTEVWLEELVTAQGGQVQREREKPAAVPPAQWLGAEASSVQSAAETAANAAAEATIAQQRRSGSSSGITNGSARSIPSSEH